MARCCGGRGRASSPDAETYLTRRSPMATRNGSAVWEGTLREGKGTVKLGSGAFEGPYSFASRFEEGAGTNPEELIGAAHAGCFSMALAAGLTKAGHNPTRIRTKASGDRKSTRLIASDAKYLLA